MLKELICAIVALTPAAGCGTAAQEKGQVTPQAKPAVATSTEANLIADFESRAKAYYDLRDKVDGGAARQTQTEDPEKLTAQRDTLRANVQKARAGAKPGDIFTADIQPLFKKLLKPAVTSSGPMDEKANKNTIKEEKPLVNIKVNAPYPENQPLSIVPPDVLLQLPKLPKDLEYRFVQKHLILYDSRASLIADVIYNAIP